MFNTNPIVLNPCSSFRSSQEHQEECDRVVCQSWFMASMEGRTDDIKRLLKRGFKVNSKMDHDEEQGVSNSPPFFCGWRSRGGEI